MTQPVAHIVYSLVCPRCRSPIGNKCLSDADKSMVYPHRERTYAAQELLGVTKSTHHVDPRHPLLIAREPIESAPPRKARPSGGPDRHSAPVKYDYEGETDDHTVKGNVSTNGTEEDKQALIERLQAMLQKSATP